MTEQRKRFCDRYFETLNGYQSAIYAGYSELSARSQASQILDEDEIQEYLQKLREEYSIKHGVNKDRVIDEYRKIAFSDVRNVLTIDGGLRSIDDLDDDTAAAISGIESFDEFTREGEKLGTNRKIKMYDKLRALEALGKHLGLFEKDNEQSKPQSTTIINLGEGVNPNEATS